MGQIADDMINGACCAICGQYFVGVISDIWDEGPELFEHGYPVACYECWEEGCGYEKAKADTL